MREIEFRGKSKDPEFMKGQWIYGYYWKEFDDRVFIGTDAGGEWDCQKYRTIIEVIPETAGQYINRKDKHGNKLYTRDLVKKHIEVYRNYFDGETLGFIDSETDFEGYIYGVIKFVPSKGYVIKKLYKEDLIEGTFAKEKGYIEITAYRTEKIGNIFDNPELLEVPNAKED